VYDLAAFRGLRSGAYSYQQPPLPIEFQTSQVLGSPSLSEPGGQGQGASSGLFAQ
jgi:hypothetical protein